MARKLIEVAPFLPLDAISVASKADKDKKTGTIKNVHKWFAPMPTPAMRALIFAAIVDAPEDERERARLLNLVERLVPPDGNAPDDRTLEEAKAEIRRCVGDDPPVVFDPFCGGGSTLIEAQRLGLPATGADLNPVAVLISRTLVELVPQVTGRPPLVGDPSRLGSIAGGALGGLLADLQHYAEFVRQRMWDEVGYLYPTVRNGETAIAWLWTRTARCPNPACGIEMPLISNLWLSKRKGGHRWLELTAENDHVGVSVGIGTGEPRQLKLSGNRPKFRCARCSDGIADEKYLRHEGMNRRLGLMPLVVVTDGSDGRRYESFVAADIPTPRELDITLDIPIAENSRWFSPPGYGFTNFGDLYLPRQLATLSSAARAIADLPDHIRNDGGDELYVRTIASVLGLGLGKLAQSNSTQTRWYIDSRNGSSQTLPAFGRHAMPMIWDFSEVNPFGGSVGDWLGQIDSIIRGLTKLPQNSRACVVSQGDARVVGSSLAPSSVLLVTDPPYFDQIGYSDLSDYFYLWHRLALRSIHPDLFRTIVTPKDGELIATPVRHAGKKEAAAQYFVNGFTETFHSIRTACHSEHPIVIVYAHRQEEKSSLGSASTGWDAMLAAIRDAGLTIEGTLPIRGTHSSRQISQGTNSLASYVAMVCRPRPDGLAPGTVADFRGALRRRLPDSVEALLGSGESMIDIRQSAVGPGMEVFCQFSRVFDGSNPVPVRRALTIINDELGRLLDEHLGLVDDETRWACQWYAEHAFESGSYDDGRKLAGVYGLGVDGLAAAGIVEQGRGKVRLLARDDLKDGWSGDSRTPTWEACQHLTKRVAGGESAAAALLAELGSKADGVRELAQYLTNLAIEKGWADDAIAYDALVKSWPRIEQLAADTALRSGTGQLFEG